MLCYARENQTLYLTAWEYNAVLILEELKKIVTNNGGVVSNKYQNDYFIVNRSINEVINNASRDIDRITERLNSGDIEMNDARKAYIEKRQKDIDELSLIDNKPVKVSNHGYITFKLDGVYYHLSLPDNPFFEVHYIKTDIKENNTYSKDACMEELDKSWLWDCFLSVIPKTEIKEDRIEVANIIYNLLLTGKKSQIIRDKHKTRVSNTYNSGYHYETIYSKERFEKVDF